MLSKFFKYVKIKDDLFAVFNTLLMDIVYVSKNELDEICKLTCTGDLMFEKGIYVQNEEIDQRALNVLREKYLNIADNIQILYLIVTTKCNLGCKYCYIENNVCNNFREEFMTTEVAKGAIDKYVNYLKEHDLKKAEVILYGGEPLVNWITVKWIIEYINSFKMDIEISIVSNATLMDDETIQFMNNNHVKIGISLDGPKEINDINRIYRNNNKSVYDRVFKTIQLLREQSVEFGLSITISEDFIDNKERVLEWLKTIPVDGIFYNLYHYSIDDGTWVEHYKKSSEFLIDSFKELIEFRQLVEGRQYRKYESLLESKFMFSDCASIGCNQVTIRPNGDISICHCYSKTNKYIIGNINNLDFEQIVKSKEAQFWRYRSPIFNEKCLDCEGLFICGGGCPAQGEAMFGTRYEIDQPFCIHTKKSLNWLLKEIYNKL